MCCLSAPPYFWAVLLVCRHVDAGLPTVSDACHMFCAHVCAGPCIILHSAGISTKIVPVRAVSPPAHPVAPYVISRVAGLSQSPAMIYLLRINRQNQNLDVFNGFHYLIWRFKAKVVQSYFLTSWANSTFCSNSLSSVCFALLSSNSSLFSLSTFFFSASAWTSSFCSISVRLFCCGG